jgi:hypothetical protein
MTYEITITSTAQHKSKDGFTPSLGRCQGKTTSALTLLVLRALNTPNYRALYRNDLPLRVAKYEVPAVVQRLVGDAPFTHMKASSSIVFANGSVIDYQGRNTSYDFIVNDINNLKETQ